MLLFSARLDFHRVYISVQTQLLHIICKFTPRMSPESSGATLDIVFRSAFVFPFVVSAGSGLSFVRTLVVASCITQATGTGLGSSLWSWNPLPNMHGTSLVRCFGIHLMSCTVGQQREYRHVPHDVVYTLIR